MLFLYLKEHRREMGHTRTVAGTDEILLPRSCQVYRSALMKLCDPLMCQSNGLVEERTFIACRDYRCPRHSDCRNMPRTKTLPFLFVFALIDGVILYVYVLYTYNK
jgi:hypothetical protein